MIAFFMTVGCGYLISYLENFGNNLIVGPTLSMLVLKLYFYLV